MENEFIPYELALALKELGFDEPCLGLYYPDGKFNIKEQNGLNCDSDKNSYLDSLGNSAGFCTAPLYQQAFRWFREKYNLWGMIYPRDGWNYSIQRVDETTSCTGESFHGVEIKSYEEAELECLKKLIEIVKEK